MLDGDHYRTAELVNELISNAQMKHTFDLIECLKPELTIVDTQWAGKTYRYDYKGIIIGTGDTAHMAMLNFQSKFYSQKLTSNEPK